MPQRETQPRKKKPEAKRLRYIVYVAVFAAVVLIMLPNLKMHSMQINVRTIITTLGVDKAGEEFEVTAQLIIPQSSQEEPEIQAIVSSKGKTVREAIDGIAIKTGRITNLSHCRLVLLGKELSEDNVAPALDYFMRSVEIDTGITLVAAKGTAKEALNELKNFDHTSAFALSEFLTQNHMNNMGTAIMLIDFLENFYSRRGDTYLPVIEIKKKEGAGGQESGGAKDTEPKSEIADKFETAVFKDGKQVKILEERDTRAMLWLDKTVQRGRLILEDVECPKGEKTKVSLTIYQKSLKIKTTLKDGKPAADIKIELKLNLEEIEGEHLPALITYEESLAFSNEINRKAEEVIRSEIMGLKAVCVENGLDVLQLERAFFRRNHKDYKKYLETHTVEQLIEECSMDIAVKTRVNF